jgi:hypothetical protein
VRRRPFDCKLLFYNKKLMQVLLVSVWVVTICISYEVLRTVSWRSHKTEKLRTLGLILTFCIVM